MTRTRGTHVLTELATYSGAFYAGLERLSGVDIGYYADGSLVARADARAHDRAHVRAHHGASPRAAGERARPLRDRRPSRRSSTTRGLVGGVLFEGDATVNPGVATFATARAAFDRGVRIVEDCRVTGFRLDGGARDRRRDRPRASIECEVAVIAAGLWSRDLGLLAGARAAAARRRAHVGADGAGRGREPRPAHPARPRRPLLRAPLPRRPGHRRLRAGRQAARRRVDPARTSPSASSSPTGSTSSCRSPKARRRVPALRGRALRALPQRARELHPRRRLPARRDGRGGGTLRGRRPELAGHHLRPGRRPGPGRRGSTPARRPSTRPSVDVRRFAPEQANAALPASNARARGWAASTPCTGRSCSPRRRAACGACRSTTVWPRPAPASARPAGWERANWYAPPGVRAGLPLLLRPPELVRGGGRGAPRGARGGRALRPLLVREVPRRRARGASTPSSASSRADLDREPGSVVYTCLLNELGGIELDVTVTRLGEEDFLVVAPDRGADEDLPLAAPARATPRPSSPTSPPGWACSPSTGPRSRELLARLDRRAARRRLVPVRHGAADRRRLGDGAGAAHLVRRRAGLGALRAGRVAASPLYDQLVARRRRPRACVTPATTPSTRSAPRRASATGARTWGRPTRRMRPAWRSPSRSTRERRSSGARRCAAAPRRAPRRRLVHLQLDDPEPLLYHGESLLAGRPRRRPRHLRRLRPHARRRRRAGLHRGAAGRDRRHHRLGRSRSTSPAPAPAKLSERAFYDSGGERMRAADGAATARP